MEFEKVLQELEEIAKKMEDKNTTLDESLALFDKIVIIHTRQIVMAQRIVMNTFHTQSKIFYLLKTFPHKLCTQNAQYRSYPLSTIQCILNSTANRLCHAIQFLKTSAQIVFKYFFVFCQKFFHYSPIRFKLQVN